MGARALGSAGRGRLMTMAVLGGGVPSKRTKADGDGARRSRGCAVTFSLRDAVAEEGQSAMSVPRLEKGDSLQERMPEPAGRRARLARGSSADIGGGGLLATGLTSEPEELPGQVALA